MSANEIAHEEWGRAPVLSVTHYSFYMQCLGLLYWISQKSCIGLQIGADINPFPTGQVSQLAMTIN